jgi:trimeric autotransporter adhesin
MKRIFLCLLALALVGCGYGSRNYSPGMTGSGGGAPAISSLTPNTATAGSMAFAMTINGSRFGTDAVVYWDAQPIGTMYVSSNQVVANITAADVATANTVPVYVRTGGMNSNSMNFTIQ